MVLMSGRELALIIKEELGKEIKQEKLKLTLAVVVVGNDDSSLKYINIKKQACKKVGIGFKVIKFKESVSEKKIIDVIARLNQDPKITGIIMQLPLPQEIDTNNILESISPNKDVDGLSSTNLGKLAKGLDGLCPATPEGIINLLRYYQVPLVSKRVLVVGQSNLVGKPLALLLLREKATVTIANSKTRNLKELAQNAEIIISATGQAKLIKKGMVSKNAVVIDVGTSFIDGRVAGDVDFENVAKNASFITPNPGGVGPMTVAMLLSNVLKAYKLTNLRGE